MHTGFYKHKIKSLIINYLHEKLYPAMQFTLRKKGFIKKLFLEQLKLQDTVSHAVCIVVCCTHFGKCRWFEFSMNMEISVCILLSFKTSSLYVVWKRCSGLWENQNPAVLIQTLIWLISGCTETQLLFWQFFSQHWVVHSVLSLTKTQTAFSSPWVWSEISASHTRRRRPIDGWWMWTLTFDSSDVRAAGE